MLLLPLLLLLILRLRLQLPSLTPAPNTAPKPPLLRRTKATATAATALWRHFVMYGMGKAFLRLALPL